LIALSIEVGAEIDQNILVCCNLSFDSRRIARR
jgi:hypothetical protein